MYICRERNVGCCYCVFFSSFFSLLLLFDSCGCARLRPAIHTLGTHSDSVALYVPVCQSSLLVGRNVYIPSLALHTVCGTERNERMNKRTKKDRAFWVCSGIESCFVWWRSKLRFVSICKHLVSCYMYSVPEVTANDTQSHHRPILYEILSFWIFDCFSQINRCVWEIFSKLFCKTAHFTPQVNFIAVYLSKFNHFCYFKSEFVIPVERVQQHNCRTN